MSAAYNEYTYVKDGYMKRRLKRWRDKSLPTDAAGGLLYFLQFSVRNYNQQYKYTVQNTEI